MRRNLLLRRLLQWLREQGFPWEVRCHVTAAEGRHLDNVRNVHGNR
jgi:hypothetical protein